MSRNAALADAVTRLYTYNAYQELCGVDEPETGTTLMGYDGAGNLAWSASGLPAGTACSSDGNTTAINARKAARTYDARNRISTLSFPDLNGNQSWSYTPDGLPASVTTYNDAGASSVVNSYLYNHRRLLASETSAQPGLYSWDLSYDYDANGHLSGTTTPDTFHLDYAPNALGQPTQAGPYATGVQYYPNGAIKQFTYGNGIVHTLAQNARGLPDVSKDAYGTTAIHQDEYAYDQVGNVLYITDAATGQNQRGNRSMVYDNLNRLTSATSPMFGTATYTYDVLDNLIRVQVTGGNQARNQDYFYDGNNRLTNITSVGATVVGLGYDVQGNLANKNGVTYTFDYGNRLWATGSIESYRYDAQGRRVQAYSPTAGSILSVYGQDGVLRFQQNGRDGTNLDYVYLGGSLVATFSYPYATGGSNGTIKYQHTDALGSPVAVTDANKTVLQRSEYEPYGYLLNRPMEDGPGYTGHVTDAATGLVYMQQRYYDPVIGRFLSRDEVTAYEKPLTNFNVYVYALNNPYRFTDPDGRQSYCSGGACAPQAALEQLKQATGWLQSKFETAVTNSDIRFQVDACSGACVSIDQSLLHGDGNFGITPVGWAGSSSSTAAPGAFVGIFAQPREGFVLTDGDKSSADTSVSGATGGEIKFGEGLAFGTDMQVSATGKIELTPKFGLGVGEVKKPVEIKLFSWDFSDKQEEAAQ